LLFEKYGQEVDGGPIYIVASQPKSWGSLPGPSVVAPMPTGRLSISFVGRKYPCRGNIRRLLTIRGQAVRSISFVDIAGKIIALAELCNVHRFIAASLVST